jgi:fimbrial chaperone protein
VFSIDRYQKQRGVNSLLQRTVGTRLAASALIGLIAFGFAGSSMAGSLTVWPVRVTLEAAGKATVVNLQNQGDLGALVQVEMFAWEDDADVDGMERSQDLLVVPPIFEVGAQSTQVIRVALRKPLEADREATYRLVITEVPRDVGQSEDGISFVVRLNLPVFVTPKGALPQPTWSLDRDAGGARLTLGNPGNAHVRVQSIALFADGGADPVFASDDGGYVLAGGERSWQLDLAKLKAGASLKVKAETNLGELESLVDIRG